MTASQLSFIAEDLHNAHRCIAPAANGQKSIVDAAQFQMAQRQIERALELLHAIADEQDIVERQPNQPIVINIATMRKAA